MNDDRKNINSIKQVNNKNLNKNNDNLPDNNKNGQALILLKQGWDKILIEYNKITEKAKKFNTSLKDRNLIKEFKEITLSVGSFVEFIKNIFFNVGINISSLDLNTNINLNIDNKKDNLIKMSYNNIYNEFLNSETLIKEIMNIQENLKDNKVRRIQNLEKKLHDYIKEIDKLDLNKIGNCYNKINNSKDKNKIDKIILKNKYVEQYDYNDFEVIEDDKRINVNTLNYDSDIDKKKDEEIIGNIINMEPKNQLDAVNYIKSLIKNQKTEEKK